MGIFPEEKRQWEINAYNDLGFILFRGGTTLRETDHGWKNEMREATSIEDALWHRFASQTPEIPIITIDDSLELNHRHFESFNVETEEDCVWLENKYEMSIYSRRHNNEWHHYYTYIKKFRMPDNYERED